MAVFERGSSSSTVPCSICLESVAGNCRRTVVTLRCTHTFHLDCIGSAFNMKGAMECPNCREIEEGIWRLFDHNRQEHQITDLSADLEDAQRIAQMERLQNLDNQFLSGLGREIILAEQLRAHEQEAAVAHFNQHPNGLLVPNGISSSLFLHNVSRYHQNATGPRTLIDYSRGCLCEQGSSTNGFARSSGGSFSGLVHPSNDEVRHTFQVVMPQNGLPASAMHGSMLFPNWVRLTHGFMAMSYFLVPLPDQHVGINFTQPQGLGPFMVPNPQVGYGIAFPENPQHDEEDPNPDVLRE